MTNKKIFKLGRKIIFRRRFKLTLFVALSIIVSLVLIHHYFSTRCYLKPFNQIEIENISLYNHGKFKSLNGLGIADELMSIARKVNLQAKCAFFEDRVNKLKQEGKVIEVKFSRLVNLTISQWIKPEDRSHIPTDANGYRILTSVRKIIFVSEGDLKGNILMGDKSYSCWAIRANNGEIDKTWMEEVNNMLGGAP